MRYPSLSARFAGMLAAGLLFLAGALGWVVSTAQDRLVEQHEVRLADRAEALATRVAERLDRLSAALAAFGTALPDPGAATAGDLPAGPFRLPDPLALWTGFARPSGVMWRATDGLFAGEDVGGSFWFALAASGQVAWRAPTEPLPQELTPDVLLDRIDLARPVVGPRGTQTGVLAVAIDWPSLAAWVAAAGSSTGRNARLVGPDGLGLAQGPQAATVEPDTPHRAAAPVDGDTAAAFGLSVVLTDDGRALAAAREVALIDALRAGLAAIAATLFLHLLFARIVLAPHTHLATAAEEIAEGRTPQIPRSRLTHEAAVLSKALHEILSRLEWHEGGPRSDS